MLCRQKHASAASSLDQMLDYSSRRPACAIRIADNVRNYTEGPKCVPRSLLFGMSWLYHHSSNKVFVCDGLRRPLAGRGSQFAYTWTSNQDPCGPPPEPPVSPMCWDMGGIIGAIAWSETSSIWRLPCIQRVLDPSTNYATKYFCRALVVRLLGGSSPAVSRHLSCV